ncbi:MAG: hypothetical protein ABIR71_06210, partial [Chthoniobacterales bacterium]
QIMLQRLLPLLVVCAAFPSLASAQEPKEMTVDQLVAKNIEAKGGIEALRALTSVKVTGKMLVNEGKIEFGYAQTRKRPGAVRTEASLQGMTMVQAYDGEEGWKISPFQGRKDPEKMSADDAKALIEEAEIDGPLIDWKEKGSKVESLGREDVDGTLAYKLKVTRKNGDINYVYLDPDHFLEIRIVSQRIERGSQVETETDLGDYEKVNGVFLPLSMESGPKGVSDKQKLILDQVEGNPPVDDSVFKFPVAPAK